MSGLRVSEPVAYRGVQVSEIVEIGESPSDEIAPIPGTITRDKGIVGSAGTDVSNIDFEDIDILGPGLVWEIGFNDTQKINTGSEPNTLYLPGNRFSQGQPLFYIGSMGSSGSPSLFDAATLAAIGNDYASVHAKNQQVVYCIKLGGDLISLARTSQDAANDVRMGLVQTVVSQTFKLFDLRILSRTKNCCFDFDNSLPAFQIYNEHPVTTTSGVHDNHRPYRTAFPSHGNMMWWKHWGSLVLSNSGWTNWVGMDLLENEPPYHPTIRQATPDPDYQKSVEQRIISLFGSGTTDPGMVGNLYYPNFARDSALETERGPVICHTSDGTASNTNHGTQVIAGQAYAWTKHEWYQHLVTHGTTGENPGTDGGYFQKYIRRAGGKIKFSAKVRLPENDPLMPLNFAGIYVRAQFDSVSNGDDTQKIWYIKFQNREDTITLPTGSLTFPAGKYNWSGPQGDGYDTSNTDCRPEDKIVTELATYYSDDFRSFKTISHEIDFTEDFAGTDPFVGADISFHLYYSENGANMAATAASSGVDGSGNPAPLDPQYHNFINNQEVDATQLIPGRKYVVVDQGSLSSTELNAIAGVNISEVPIIDIQSIKGERSYELVSHNSQNNAHWNNILVDNFNGTSTPISEKHGFVNQAPNYYPAIGTHFKVFSVAGNISNLVAQVRETGYPVGSVIDVQQAGTTATGAFAPTSGSIQFFSPTCEYIPG